MVEIASGQKVRGYIFEMVDNPIIAGSNHVSFGLFI